MDERREDPGGSGCFFRFKESLLSRFYCLFYAFFLLFMNAAKTSNILLSANPSPTLAKSTCKMQKSCRQNCEEGLAVLYGSFEIL